MSGVIRKCFSIIMIMLMIMPFTWVAFADDAPAEEAEDSVSQTTEEQPETGTEAAAAKSADPEAASSDNSIKD